MDRAKLLKHFPTLEIRNRTGLQQTIQYLNGDSVTINAGAPRKITSEDLLQIPDSATFELVKPTLFDLVKKGVIELKEAAPTEEKVKGNAPEPTPGDSKAAADADIDLSEAPNAKTVMLSAQSEQNKSPVEQSSKDQRRNPRT